LPITNWHFLKLCDASPAYRPSKPAAAARTHILEADWVAKKFLSPKKKEMPDLCWKGINWQYKFVHGKVYD
jgi:hypothetical protein